MRIALIVLIVALICISIVVSHRFTFGCNEGYISYPIKGIFLQGTEVLLPVNLELARTPKEIERGLMNRKHLASNSGMLFWFDKEEERAFWMRNTLIPLDMVFVNSSGRITNIVHSATPESDRLRKSTEPVQYVVELPGGTIESHGVEAGDHFQWTY